MGTLARDRSGNNYNGTLANGPVPTIGKIGQALNFDGSNDEVNIDTAQVGLTAISALTISAWVNITSYGTAGTAFIRTVIGDDVAGGDGTVNVRIGTDGTEANQAKLHAHTITPTTRDNIDGTTALSLKTWYHVVYTWEQNGSQIIYINGIVEASGAGLNETTDTNPSGTLFIGEDNTRSRNWSGKIDDFRIYNRSLSATEIQMLYNFRYQHRRISED